MVVFDSDGPPSLQRAGPGGSPSAVADNARVQADRGVAQSNCHASEPVNLSVELPADDGR
jgi:hypothetical protein